MTLMAYPMSATDVLDGAIRVVKFRLGAEGDEVQFTLVTGSHCLDTCDKTCDVQCDLF